MTRKRPDFSADFETTTDPLDCRVWVWGIAPITSDDAFQWGTDIDSFMDYVSGFSANIYFHNLKFDGGFFVDWLLKQGYVFREDTRSLKPGEFTGVISNMNKWYAITVCWSNTGLKTEFKDSLKKLPMSADAIAHMFDLPIKKGKIDYHKYRPIGYEPTDEELDYLENDVMIIAMAMRLVLASGMTRLTVGSDSLAEYKRINSTQWFNRTFPTLSDEMDAEIRRALRGGFTHVIDRFRDRRLGAGIVLDVNSLYPSVMKNTVLPYGEPDYVEGKVEPTTFRPCVIFSVTFTARLKPEHVPCIQIKGSSLFGGTEYLSNIDEPVTLMVTNVDWELYQDHYDIRVLSYNGGWAFRGVRGMFDTYIDKWMTVKAESTGGAREIAKLHLNSLWGKFTSNPNITGKVPELENDAVHLRRGEDKKKAPVYTALGVFVTSYARDLTIRAAQANYDNFVYADTDSLHLMTDPSWTGVYVDEKTGREYSVPDTLEIHPSRIGAWKFEYDFVEAHYLRSKAYLCLKENGTYKVAFAGLPESVQKTLTFDKIMGDSFTLSGKMEHHTVPGGVVLRDKPYTFKR